MRSWRKNSLTKNFVSDWKQLIKENRSFFHEYSPGQTFSTFRLVSLNIVACTTLNVLGHPCWMMLNVVERCWKKLEHVQTFVRQAFNIYVDYADSGMCWMRLAIPYSNTVQHRSTMLRGVEQNVESVWPWFNSSVLWLHIHTYKHT